MRVGLARRPSPGRIFSALVCAPIIHLALGGGLALLLPGWALGALAGTLIGIVAGFPLLAVAAAALVVPLALLLPPWYVDPAAGFAGAADAAPALALTAVVAAALAGWAASHWRDSRIVEIATASVTGAAIVALLWTSALTLNRSTVLDVPLNAALQSDPQPGTYASDSAVYLRIHRNMERGIGYYDAVREAWAGHSMWGRLPAGVTSYRLPTFFWLWAWLERVGVGLVAGTLALASVAVVSALWLGRLLVRSPLAVLGATLVAAYLLFVATSEYITYVDAWAGSLAVLSAAAFVHSVQRESSAWRWVAVGAALAAVLLREHLLYLALAGCVACFLAEKTGRARLRAMLPWLGVAAAFGAWFALHVAGVGGQIDRQANLVSWWTNGGIGHVAAIMRFGHDFVLGDPLALGALVVLGMLGAVAALKLARRPAAWFLIVSVWVPMLASLVIGNDQTRDGVRVGYWGLMFVPLVLALVPVAIGWAELAFDARFSAKRGLGAPR